ncbi:hypothetical protein ACM41_24355 [Bradyrhizobium sp. CCBAU 21362]|uniref:hypothetical protein n=1 Tax=Bradyrhizobium sp. CCBAU 21362 TaxID=1325082 RepID=UPI00230643C9|nr:hypothetical protein [Bradyrhizobium sp. CCBAU 21362]MDA9539236.1 hypothetical protein [Bradyrhizobium sp. CCBAU 21362]
MSNVVRREQPLVLVCALVMRGRLLLPDNKVGYCASCGMGVQYRPHAPTPHELRCVDCTIKLAKPDDQLVTTAQILHDWHAFVRRGRH